MHHSSYLLYNVYGALQIFIIIIIIIIISRFLLSLYS